MDATVLRASLTTLLRELVHGTAPSGGFVLNSGDGGLLAAIDRLSPREASSSAHGGATIAAHVDHVRYGLSLMNQWAAGANPFATADWNESWKIGAVSDAEWSIIRRGLRDQADAWLTNIGSERTPAEIELTGMIGSIAHLAYHLGAIRQIHGSLRGPKESAA